MWNNNSVDAVKVAAAMSDVSLITITNISFYSLKLLGHVLRMEYDRILMQAMYSQMDQPLQAQTRKTEEKTALTPYART